MTPAAGPVPFTAMFDPPCEAPPLPVAAPLSREALLTRNRELLQALQDILERSAIEATRAGDAGRPFPASVVQGMFATVEAMARDALKGGEGVDP